MNGALLHAQDVADGGEVEVLAVLLPDTLLHELVPVEGRERPGRKIQGACQRGLGKMDTETTCGVRGPGFNPRDVQRFLSSRA